MRREPGHTPKSALVAAAGAATLSIRRAGHLAPLAMPRSSRRRSVILASWPWGINRTPISAREWVYAPVVLTPDGLKPSAERYSFCAASPPPTRHFPSIRRCLF